MKLRQVMQASSSNFSVEQVELIRRLRNSGITCKQLVDAFQAFERIDATFGNTFNSPACNGVQDATTVVIQDQSSMAPYSTNKSANNIHSGAPTNASQPIMARSPSSAEVSHPLQMIRSGTITETTQNHVPLTSSSPQRSSLVRVASDVSLPVLSVPSFTDVAKVYPECPNNTSDFSESSDKEHNSTHNHSQNRIPQCANLALSQAADLTQDQCLILVKCSGHDKVAEFVKRCLMSADFKPFQKTQDIGVSESTLQAFLQGDVLSIEQSACNNLLGWIISLCYHTEWFTFEMAKLLHFQGFGSGLGFQFSPRRERFTFREKHLDVMETFWKRKQYPTFEEKEHIAEECNCAMAEEVQRPLDDKEKVTHVNVANWFKNKRKELKRISKRGETNGETVKTFLDSLSSKSRSISVAVEKMEANNFEDASVQHQNENSQTDNLVCRSLAFDSNSSDHIDKGNSSSDSGGGSVLSIIAGSESTGADQQPMFSNHSDIAGSYPLQLFQNSRFNNTVIVSCSQDTLSSSSGQPSHNRVVTLSTNGDKTTNPMFSADALPTPYPENTVNHGIGISPKTNALLDIEIPTVKQEL
ncbi:hypothetical protein EGW08_008400 [Elysia chlorotica]|uniref:Uncharacterized protein n=1 Tax=Elysia chlorotica TaxID=188477 RepID=A0A3S1A6C0_ELYCH|nr:hypothetical protein EGW08_008400 [Elysia chlorotica]